MWPTYCSESASYRSSGCKSSLRYNYAFQPIWGKSNGWSRPQVLVNVHAISTECNTIFSMGYYQHLQSLAQYCVSVC